MKIDFVLQLAAYTVPALITAAISYIYFSELLKRQAKKDAFFLQQKGQMDILPIKLQAYERFTILLERIDLTKIVLRVAPISIDKTAYQVLLIQHIEQEFEYNLSQQIYISKELWNILSNIKTNIILHIQATASDAAITDADSLRKSLINYKVDNTTSVEVGLLAIKEEVNFYTK